MENELEKNEKNAETEKPKSYKKYLLVFGMLLCLGFVSAALVTYYGTFVSVVNVDTPIEMETNIPTSFDLVAGEPYQTFYFSVDNKLDENIPLDVEIVLEEKIGSNWTNVVDDEGFYLGFTEADCLEDDICNLTSYEADLIASSLSQWWILNDKSSPANCDATIMDITNNPNIIEVPLVGGVLTTVGSPLAGFPLLPGSSYTAGKYYGAVYVETSTAVVPGKYRVTVNILPA